MCRPEFVESASPFLAIRAGVNPCVQAALDSKDCIPNDIAIGAEEGADAAAGEPPLLLVTGPNMGGKSTLLRQACLTTLMAHLGCWVPAAACRLSPVDRIFTRVGANDAIMAGLSTFRVELEETALILKHATRHSLVILDELGRGTATFDGMAIAHAVMRELIAATCCRTLFATHYHALTREFERPNPHVGLYHMACVIDDATRAVTFLYKFEKGASTRSHGVHVARLAGLPEPLLELAAAKSERLEAALEEQHLLHLAGLLASATTAEEARAVWTAAQVLPAH
jgi:DNA mismatch repair protein MSH6